MLLPNMVQSSYHCAIKDAHLPVAMMVHLFEIVLQVVIQD